MMSASYSAIMEFIVLLLSIFGLAKIFVILLRIALTSLIDEVRKLRDELRKSIRSFKEIDGCPER